MRYNKKEYIYEIMGVITNERYLVKVSLYKVYTHNNMTNKQWDTVCKFCNKYQLSEQKVEELDNPIGGFFRCI